MSERIANNILSAVDILLDKKLAEAKFDRTITGTIDSCEDEEIGKYKVAYQNAIITAYSSSPSVTYSIGDQVYISIPENDFTKDKIILGAVGSYKNALPSYTTDESMYTRLGANYVAQFNQPITEQKTLFNYSSDNFSFFSNETNYNNFKLH